MIGPPPLVILGHGTRHAPGQEEFQHLVDRVADQRADVVVRPAFLEWARPSLEEVLEQLVRAGHRRAVLCPLLLMESGHARRDVPTRARCWESRGIRLAVTPTLRDAVPLRDLSSRQLAEAQAAAELPPGKTVQILVARGGLDPDLPEQLAYFARSRRVGQQARIAFWSLAQPGWRSVSRHVAADGRVRSVVVQPHFLFRGRLLERLDAEIGEWQERSGRRQLWIRVPHLGPQLEVAQAVLDHYARYADC